MIEYSKTTHLDYNPDDAVFYRNCVQSAWMISKPDCVLLDVFEDNGKLVFAFPKYLHRKYIKEWVERKKCDGDS